MKDYTTPAVVFARAALARGPLTEHRVMANGKGVFWRCGNRLFSARTVRLLIANGEAVRVGSIVSRVAEAVRRTPRSAPSANEQDTSRAGGATIAAWASIVGSAL